MKQRYQNYEIEAANDHNYTVSRAAECAEGPSKGQEVLAVIGYYNSLQAAVKRVGVLIGNGADDLKGWLAEFSKVQKAFDDMLNPKETT